MAPKQNQPVKKDLESEPLPLFDSRPESRDKTVEDAQEERTAKEMKVKGRSVEARTDVSIERLDDKAQAQVIEKGIDFNVPIEQQPENAKIPLLFAFEYEIIPHLLEAG